MAEVLAARLRRIAPEDIVILDTGPCSIESLDVRQVWVVFLTTAELNLRHYRRASPGRQAGQPEERRVPPGHAGQMQNWSVLGTATQPATPGLPTVLPSQSIDTTMSIEIHQTTRS